MYRTDIFSVKSQNNEYPTTNFNYIVYLKLYYITFFNKLIKYKI